MKSSSPTSGTQKRSYASGALLTSCATKARKRLLQIVFGAACLLLGHCTVAAAGDGVLPLSKDGRALNLDFEDGTLKDWSATGTAFEKQPIKGDTVAPRRGDMKSNHQGNYWIGTFEIAGD